MGCLNSSRRALLQARLTKKLQQLADLEETYDEMVKDGNVESYKFDSGEGSQQTKYRSLKDVSDAIENLESQIDLLYRKLNGGGIVNMNMRRKGYGRRGF